MFVIVGIVAALTVLAGVAVATLVLRTGSTGGLGVLTSSTDWPGTPPMFRDLNGDGVDDLVGARMNGEAMALDGRTGKEIWRKAIGYPALGYAFLPDHLAVLEGQSVVLYDLRTGNQGATFTPPWQDKPGRLVACGTSLYAVAIDDTAVRIDSARGTMTVEPLRAGCEPARRAQPEPPCRGAHATCEPDKKGTYGRYPTTLRDETTKQTVLVRFKEKGTAIATVLRIEPADGQSIVVAPEGDLQAIDIAGDWVVVARGKEVFAYDFATKASWVVPLETEVKTSDFDHGWLRIEKGRVFVQTSRRRRGPSSKLHVLDLATGKSLWT